MLEEMDKLVCVEDFEKAAYKILDQNALAYFKTGADDEITLQENKSAFKRWFIRPRILRDVSNRDLSTKVLGKSVGFPMGISPTALQKLAHEDGELANTRAAASMDTYILPTISTSSLEKVGKANPYGRKWFQLYVYKDDKNNSINLIRRAEACGFEALVLTVDCTYLGKRRINLRNKFYFPKHLRLANFQEESDDESDCVPHSTTSLNLVHSDLFETSLTWRDVAWFKNNTSLPIIVKGILTAEDASLAIKHGASGIFVSNHGGRQLDTVLATIDVLPEIVNEVKGRCEIYIDGGVSTGTDIFKALALGANMVFAGRPFLWGLAVGGEEGVKRVLEIFKEELDLTMALSGVQNVTSIDNNYVERASNL